MNDGSTLHVLGLRVPETVITTLAIMLVVVVVLWPLSRRMRTHGLAAWQTVLETYVSWVRGVVEEIFGEDPEPYTSLIGTLIAFIAFSNLLGVVPRVRPPTSDLDTTVALALVVFFAVPYFGIRRHGLFGYLRRYGDPHPLLAPLNVFGELTRTLALAMRLFGNVMSGQMVGAILLVVAGVLVPVPIMALGILTALVQAYIFGILAAVYIAAAVAVQAPPPSAPQRPPTPEPLHG